MEDLIKNKDKEITKLKNKNKEMFDLINQKKIHFMKQQTFGIQKQNSYCEDDS
jgi:hypothetical protein